MYVNFKKFMDLESAWIWKKYATSEKVRGSEKMDEFEKDM